MAVYKISDLLDCLNSMRQGGIDFVELEESDAYDDEPVSLWVSGIADKHSTVEDSIDSVSLPDGYSCRNNWL